MAPPNQFNTADTRRLSIGSSRGSSSTPNSNSSSLCTSPRSSSTPAMVGLSSSKKRASSSQLLMASSLNSNSENTTGGGLTRCSSFSSNSSLNSSVSSTSSSKRRSRLLSDLEASRLYLGVRQDIDMVQQQKEANERKKKAMDRFVEKHTPIPLTYQQKVFSLKSIVTEAERFQNQRKMKDLKMTVLGRAAEALGAACPRNYFRVTKPSNVVASDIDLILAMDRSQLPSGADPMGFAAGAVLALPLWLPNRLEGNNPSRRVSPPEHELVVSRNSATVAGKLKAGSASTKSKKRRAQ